MATKKRKIENNYTLTVGDNVSDNLDKILKGAYVGDTIDYIYSDDSYIKLEIKKKYKKLNEYYIYEGQDFEELKNDIFKKATIGDIIHYITNNQLGVRKYEIILDEKEEKDIKEIGDIWGNYDDLNHPDNAHNSY